MKMKNVLMLLMALILGMSVVPAYAQGGQTDIYLSPNGDDSGNGSIDAPFKTLERAQEEARKLADTASGDIVINLKGGDYYLEKPFLMDERDSGKNGNKIIWKSAEGEKAVISGGRRVSGWTQHNGNIWKLSVPEEFKGRYISNLYINDKVATMARIEEQHFHGVMSDGVTSDGEDTWQVEFEADDLPYNADYTDIFLKWRWNWRYYIYKSQEVEKNDKGNLVVKLEKDLAKEMAKAHNMTEAYFTVSNAYDFIDRPGEFYYDKEAGEIFYYKHSEEDLTTAETILPYLEYLWRMEGSLSTTPIENVEIRDLTFSHSMCQRNYTHNSYIRQSCISEYDSASPEFAAEVPWRYLNRGAVEMFNVTNSVVEGNEFCYLDNIGIALYTGVEDVAVRKNVFYDISDVAIAVGHQPEGFEVEEEKETGMTKISVRKPIVTGEGYKQINLGNRYSISLIEIPIDKNSQSLLEVWGSNSEDFKDYKVLAKQSKRASEMAEGGATQYDALITDKNKYQYLRVVDKSGPITCGNFKVFSEDLGGAENEKLCEDIEISQNYMTRTSREFWSSTVIHVFDARNVSITHNEINGCPYTAISLGWMWNDRYDLPGHKINYNRIINTNQRLHDGAGIYVLGSHSESEMVGNYITGCVNAMGGIYPDNGSTHWVISENIVENVNVSFHPWSADQDSLTFKNNYTTAPYYVVGATNTTMENTELFVRNNMPAHIKEKADLAGLGDAYDELHNKVPEGDVPSYMAVLKNGQPDKNTYTQYFMNSSGFYLQAAVSEAEHELKTAKTSNLINETNIDIYNAFEDELITAKEVLNSSEFDRDLYYDTLNNLKAKTEEFSLSGIFNKENYKTATQYYGIAVEGEEEEVSVISADAPINLDLFIDDYDNLRIGDGSNTFRTRDKQEMFIGRTNGTVSYYKTNKFGDVIFEGKVKFEPGAPSDWQGFILRSPDANSGPANINFTGYIIDFIENTIEVQKFNEGVRKVFYGNIGVEPEYALELSYGDWDRTQLSDIKITIKNEDDGVHISMEANGKELFSIVDDDENAITEGGYFGIVSPAGSVIIEKSKENVTEFLDLTNFEWAKTAIYQLAYENTVNGTSKGIFSPAKDITRAEFSKILAGLAGCSGDKTEFSDMTADKWYYSYVAGLEEIGAYNNIFSEAFDGDTPIKREEMAAMCYNVLVAKGYDTATADVTEFADAEDISEALREAVGKCASVGIVKGMGENKFMPANTARRAEAATLLYNVLSYMSK